MSSPEEQVPLHPEHFHLGHSLQGVLCPHSALFLLQLLGLLELPLGAEIYIVIVLGIGYWFLLGLQLVIIGMIITSTCASLIAAQQ